MTQPLSEAQKRYFRRLNGTRARFALDTAQPPMKNIREFNAPVVSTFVPRKPRGKSGTFLSPAKRAMVAQRASDRAAFFASFES